MAKRTTLVLDDPLHKQLSEMAGRAGTSMHQWMLEALSREVFRQLTAESKAWCEAHPEHADAQAARHAARRLARRGDV